MKIYVVRHGETTGDIEDRYGGAYDDHLTNKGREQLRHTGENLVGKNIEIIFSSPYIRTKESAEIIRQSINCPIEIIDGLKERNYGVLGGLTKQEALEKYPEAVELHKNFQNTDPNGESYNDFSERVVEALLSIVKKDYGIVAVVSHGGPIKQILTHLGLPLPESIGDGEIMEINVSTEGNLL